MTLKPQSILPKLSELCDKDTLFWAATRIVLPFAFIAAMFVRAEADVAQALVGVGLWVVGGNILIALHRHRLQKPIHTERPFEFPFKRFDTRELLILAVLFVVSIGLLWWH